MGMGAVRWCGVVLVVLCTRLVWAQDSVAESPKGAAHAPPPLPPPALPNAPPPPGPPPPPPASSRVEQPSSGLARETEEPSRSASAIPEDRGTVHWVMPDRAAAKHSPFINAAAGGITISKHFDSSAYLGAEFGAFFDDRIRVSARALFPFGVAQGAPESLSNSEFRPIHSAKPALIYGGGAGIALYSGQSFLLSLQANYQRTDVGDFGHMLALALPFEWMTNTGLRVGFEAGVLRAFGGQVFGECGPSPFVFDSTNSQENLTCDIGEVRAFDREPGNGLWVHFALGYPYDRPEPQLVLGD